MITLVVKEPGQNDKVFEYRGTMLVIGRSEDAGLMLPNVSVSRRHCCVKARGNDAILEDLFSENGIMVNGTAKKEHILASGDSFVVGRYTVVTRHPPLARRLDSMNFFTMSGVKR